MGSRYTAVLQSIISENEASLMASASAVGELNVDVTQGFMFLKSNVNGSGCFPHQMTMLTDFPSSEYANNLFIPPK
jgi:hypothetical protein